MKFVIPDKVRMILDKLEACGFEAYIVGGCVRDSLLGRTPKDWDITTSALPQQVKEIFARTLDTGIAHGTVTVMIGKEPFEVTTYRIDGQYADSRHPDRVAFTASLAEDLARRDFTINAMAYHPRTGVIDLFGGMDDLVRRRIRCVRDPDERFNEDALRMMRAVRFAAQLDFAIEEQTAAAIRRKAGRLRMISAERVRMELTALLCSEHPRMLAQAHELGITAEVLPEYDLCVGIAQNCPNHTDTVDVHTLKAVANIAPAAHLRLAMLFHDMGKPAVKTTGPDGQDVFKNHAQVSARIAGSVMSRLRYDNETIRRVQRLVRWHSCGYFTEPAAMRRALYEIGDDIFKDLICVQRADLLAKNPAIIPQKMPLLEKEETVWQTVISSGDCYRVDMLAIGGRELLAEGIEKGPKIGEILRQLTLLVIEQPQLNTPDALLEIVRSGTLMSSRRQE